MTQRAIDGNCVYFVTANIQDRQWFFVTRERAATLGQTIVTCCRLKKFDLLAYCILPNHVHLLVRKLSRNEVFPNTKTQPMLGSTDCERDMETKQKKGIFLYPHRRLPSLRPLSPETRHTLSDLIHSIRSTFSHAQQLGKFWQRRSSFRIVDAEQCISNVVEHHEKGSSKRGIL